MKNYLKKKSIERNGIICFEINDLDAKKISNFYKTDQFPNYKENDDRGTILKKGNKNLLASQFKAFVGMNKKVLEVGCGTGQLSNYFAMNTNNEIVALDTTPESLELANNFAKKNKLSNVKFINADIFDNVLSNEYFDFIWCNGVLHHTKNPKKAFEITIKSLKKNGYVLVGLYNKFGRLRTFIRKFFSKIFGNNYLSIFDPILRKLKISDAEKKAWINDQYFHPIESTHTLDEVILWFKDNNIKYVNSLPQCDFEYDLDFKNLFEEKSLGDSYSRIFNQICMIFNQLGGDGGLFFVIGRKL